MRRFTLASAALIISAMAAPALAQSGEYSGALVVDTLAPSASDLGRAQSALAQGDYRRAAFLFTALADGALDPRINLMAGFAHLGAGETARAETYFHRALRRDAGNVQARQGLGLAAIARGDRTAARAQLDRLDRARAACDGTCSRGADIESAAASLRRAIG